MSLRSILVRLKRIAQGETINGAYKKMPINALDAFKGDLLQVVEASHGDQLLIHTLEADNAALREALNGYRAAVSFIAADSWDGCSDCINTLKAARNADWLHDLHDPDDIAMHSKRIRKHASAVIARGIPKSVLERSNSAAHLDMQTAILMAMRFHGVREDIIEHLVHGDRRDVPPKAIATMSLAALNQAYLMTRNAVEVRPLGPNLKDEHYDYPE